MVDFLPLSPLSPRYLGTETEYAIMCKNPTLSPIVSSTHAVVAYASMHTSARSRWDYTDEAPLKDQRGFDLRRYHTVPVIDPNAIGVANVVLPNGARYYVDHAHPEYSSPECSNAYDAMVWDAAGDLVLNQAREDIAQLWEQKQSVLGGHDPCPPLRFYKNNVDGKGASYGSHENYQIIRDAEFEILAQALVPFFTTRQIFAGAGRVGIGPESERPGFQISQRADYMEQDISLETTLNRGIVNTRDEPHADFRYYRRLHVIVGDANLSHTANLLKLGTTSLVLDAIESGVDFRDLKLLNAVREIKAVSHDTSCTHTLELADGRFLTARQIQYEYLSRIKATSEIDRRVQELWSQVLDMLAEPLSTSHLLDWTAKLALIQGYVDRGVAWDDPKLQLIDLQYADIDPARSLYHALVRKGRMETIATDEEITAALHNPPEDSRAWARGKVTEVLGEEIAAASWQTLTLNSGEIIELNEVDQATRAELEAAGGVEAWVASQV